MYKLSASAIALASALATSAAAETLEASGGVIVVTGQRYGYGTDVTSTATRTDTPVQDVPQAISIVSEKQIEDQALRSIGDVLRVVPGATIGQGEGHRDQITLRGNNTTADFFVDGLRDDVQYYRPLYNVARVEVLRGPNAMIFGRGGGGGVVNRVSKLPVFTASQSGSLSVDSFGAWYADVDVNQPLSTNAAVRLNAVYEHLENHRDVYEGEVWAVNPTLRVLPGPNTGFSLSYEYVDDSRVVDRGIPAEGGGSLASPARPLEGFRDTFFGSPEVNRSEFTGHIARAALEQRFSDAVTLTSRLLYGDYDKFYSNVFPSSAVRTDAAGRRVVDLGTYYSATQRENLFSQNDLVWTFGTGAWRNTLLAGVELGRQETGNQRLNGFFGGTSQRATVALGDVLGVPPVQFRGGAANGERSSDSDLSLFAVYAQNQMEFGPLELIAGVRFDRFDLEVVDVVAGQSFARTDDLISPRLGLVLKPMEQVSLYASYARSYLPQSGDQFSALDVTAAALEPERFDNYELGAKWQPIAGLLLSAALYQLDRTNTRAAGANPGEIVQTGKTRARGLELEAVGQITRAWSLSASAAFQEGEIRTNTSAAPAGREVAQFPNRQASLWTRYDFTPAIGAGLGIQHQSASFASISNAVVLPAFTRVDAAVFFKLAPNIDAQINVENLLGEEYFFTAHSDNNISTGAPRNARATVRFRF